MPAYCRCPCHQQTRGDALDAEQRGDAAGAAYFASESHLDIPPLVDLTSQLESLVSIGCRCGVNHCRLPLPKPKYMPPSPWNPEADGTGTPEG
jgi:hypothetical protein